MSSKKQTTVEWLQEPLLNILTHQQQMQVIGLFHQALAMEKEQIIEAYCKGDDNIGAEQYYKENYGN